MKFHFIPILVDEFWSFFREILMKLAASFAVPLRASMRTILARRYWGILSVAIQRAVAQCVSPEFLTPTAAVFPLPDLETLFASSEAPDVSRLP